MSDQYIVHVELQSLSHQLNVDSSRHRVEALALRKNYHAVTIAKKGVTTINAALVWFLLTPSANVVKK